MSRLKSWERGLRARYNTDLSTPEARRRAQIYMRWFDHEILRGVWHNEHEIAPGVWRSNHPTEARLHALKARGIHTILSLRGHSDAAHNLIERDICARLGLTLRAVELSARAAPARQAVLGLIDEFRQIAPPFLMHCKSGADRAGFASAVYLLTMRNASLTEARGMLSWRYWHFARGASGVLDHILDLYEASGCTDFARWIATEYDAAEAQRSFAAR